MTGFTWRLRIGTAVLASLLAVAAWGTFSGPAQARVYVGVGVYPGYYAPPPPYYAYPYPYPYPSYPYSYPYAEPGPYGGPGYAPPPAAYAPPAAYPPPSAAPTPEPQSTTNITYTNRPAFTNSSGQTCREFSTTQMVNGAPQQALGTACRDASGQWRVAN
jgi:hypothetical protein